MRYDIHYLLERVNNNPLAFCERFLPGGRREGNYWLCGDKTGIAGSSMAVHLSGEKTGKWFDYATGEHGNFIDILADRCGSRRLCDLFNCFGHYMPAPSMPAPSTPAPASSSSDDGWKRLWNNARAVNNSPAQLYLVRRGIDLVPNPLRYSPRTFVRIEGHLRKLPALLAPITDVDAQIIGVAKTFLSERGDRKAAFETNKRVAGSLRGGAVRFFSPSAAANFSDLIIGEGVETIMSVLDAIPAMNAAACLTAGNLAIFTPPPTVRRLWIAYDNDHAGVSALNALTARLGNDLIVHAIAPLKNDHNDDLMADATVFRRRLQSIFSFKATELTAFLVRES